MKRMQRSLEVHFSENQRNSSMIAIEKERRAILKVVGWERYLDLGLGPIKTERMSVDAFEFAVPWRQVIGHLANCDWLSAVVAVTATNVAL